MKICAAQIKSVKGAIQPNIEKHKRLIELAVFYKADTIIFPELSLTGYEPALAKELATDENDSRFDEFQKISDENKIIIGTGLPIKNTAGICISMIFFHPNHARQIYSKKYLHADEEPFFVPGENTAVLISQTNIAPAICYELSVPEHSENAFKLGAEIYMASVAKSAAGVEKAAKSLAEIAGKYSMTVLMSNCVGYCDNFESRGGSAIWNNKGLLLAQLNGTDEGIIMIDTETQQVTIRQLV
jgi:predicted amidohydrolase